MRQRRLLLDTGPLVALLNDKDNLHHRAVEFFRGEQAAFITTWPVITEVCHFLPVVKQARFMRMIGAGAIAVGDILLGAGRIAALQEKYADFGPDLADVSLIYLAEQTGINQIVTTDETDFGIYRIGGRKRFEIVGP